LRADVRSRDAAPAPWICGCGTDDRRIPGPVRFARAGLGRRTNRQTGGAFGTSPVSFVARRSGFQMGRIERPTGPEAD
jgi:hypothetical protein